MTNDTNKTLSKPRKAINQKNMDNGTVKQSEKITLIIAAAVMTIGVFLGQGFFYFAPLLIVMIVLDIFVTIGSINSEEIKRLIIFFSLLGSVVSLALIWMAYQFANGGLTF